MVLLILAFAVATVPVSGASPAASPSVTPRSIDSAPVRINERGDFPDAAVWMYRLPDGRYVNGPGIKGTNESIVLPSPAPGPGSALAGVTLVRHHFETLGYPMHIGLVEKLFAVASGVPIFVSDAFGLWEYQNGTPASQERGVKTSVTSARVEVIGPLPASGPIPAEVTPAFEFAKHLVRSIPNLPANQKDMNAYVAFFVEGDDTIWVELGPRFGPGETPHLGCQTQLGRDMVIGFDRKQTSPISTGKFLQCF